MGYRDATGSSTWAIVTGTVLVILGLAAILLRMTISTALALAFPLFLTAKGILEAAGAFRARLAGAAMWDLVFGLIAILAGVLVFASPALAGLTLVAILGGYFFIEGVARLVVGFLIRGLGTGWGWVMAAGALDVGLGILMISSPTITLQVIAFLIGLNILAAGIAMIMIGMLIRPRHLPAGVRPV